MTSIESAGSAALQVSHIIQWPMHDNFFARTVSSVDNVLGHGGIA